MTPFNMTKQKLAKLSHTEILKSMGYSNMDLAKKSLEAFLATKTLYEWLNNAHFDMRYTSKEFYVELLKSLSIYDDKAVEEELASIKEHQQTITAMQTPYIFADTEFRRKNEPIFALAFMEGRRRIQLDKERLIDLSLEDSLHIVSKMIKEHFDSTEGKIPLWGTIKRYNYHHHDGAIYIFDTKGELQKRGEGVQESMATLSIR